MYSYMGLIVDIIVGISVGLSLFDYGLFLPYKGAELNQKGRSSPHCPLFQRVRGVVRHVEPVPYKCGSTDWRAYLGL